MNRYGAFPSILIEDPAWQALSLAGKVVYMCAEVCRENTICGLFLYHPAVLAQYAGLTVEATEAALGELETRPTPRTSFIMRDGRLLWLRRHLEWHRGVSVSIPNHRKSVRDVLITLPGRSPLVRKFRKTYKSWLVWHPDDIEIPSGSHRHPPPPPTSTEETIPAVTTGGGAGGGAGQPREAIRTGHSEEFRSREGFGSNLGNGLGKTLSEGNSESPHDRQRVIDNVAAALRDRFPNESAATLLAHAIRLVDEQRQARPDANSSAIFAECIKQLERAQ